jgi:hypothetical protein
LPHSVHKNTISFLDLFTATMCTNIIKAPCQKVTFRKIVFKKAKKFLTIPARSRHWLYPIR